MNRGDVYWCEFPPPDKLRPVVVLTHGASISHLNAVVVATITRTIRHVPTEVLVGPEDGLNQISAVNLHQLHTVTKKKLKGRVTTLGESRMSEIRAAAIMALDLFQGG